MKKSGLFFLTFIGCLTFATRSHGQTPLIRKAYKELAHRRYAAALPLFKSVINADPQNINALNSLVLIYTKKNQFDSALYYKELAEKNKNPKSTALAEMYAMEEKYEAAQEIYKLALQENRTKVAEDRLYGFTNVSKWYLDSLDYKVYNTSINTKFKEYNPTFFNEGLIFESNRVLYKKSTKRKLKLAALALNGAGNSKLYFQATTDQLNGAKETKQTANLVTAFSKNGYYVGAISFTADGHKAYYTINKTRGKRNSQSEIWETSLKDGVWTNHHKLFFNNPGSSYFHPAITPDGKRLYYASDDPLSGKGGADLYYVDKNEDGTWRNTVNLGEEINTPADELSPTYYEGALYFSSNGRPGMGGLDIYRAGIENGKTTVKNLGFPINSSKDDFSFCIKEGKGFFTSNRHGSDDVLGFDYTKALIKLKGNLLSDGNCISGKKVYLTQKSSIGTEIIVDSAVLDANCGYVFKVRPNQGYTLVSYDKTGDRFEQPFVADNYVAASNDKGEQIIEKQIALINTPSKEKQIQDKIAEDRMALAKEEAKMNKHFKLTIDSLKQFTNDYTVLHHPYDNIYVVEKDLPAYYKLIERVKKLHNKRIFIVSATDCSGADAYNQDLSNRRSARIYKTLSKLSDNQVLIKNVGEKELLKDCDEHQKDHNKQLENRYSYVFILDK